MKTESNGAIVRISRFLTLILRHAPETIHVNMDKNGWVDINELIDNAYRYKNMRLNNELIKTIVATNDKQRYIISDDGKRIRANQGHSIAVDFELESKVPPDMLYHGTTGRFLNSIFKDGLKVMRRQYVHLSPTEEIAMTVGKRHWNPVVLYINTKKMCEDGYKFFLSKNNVWLVKEIPVKYHCCPV